METIPSTRSNTLFASTFATALAATLLIAPLTMKAEIFGYAGIKGGYAHQRLNEIVLRPVATQKSNEGIYFKPSYQSSIPLGANVGLGYSFTPRFGIRLEAEYIYISYRHTANDYSLESPKE